jgi:dipeptidyl-peptidase-4
LSSGFNLPTKEFFVLKQIGNELNAWMIKPKDFDASKEVPGIYVSIFGPGSQQVMNAWASSNDYWFMINPARLYCCLCRWKRNGYKS